MRSGMIGLMLILFAMFINIYGIVMCFQANVVIGVASLFLQGAGAVQTLTWWIFNYNIAQHVAVALGLH